MPKVNFTARGIDSIPSPLKGQIDHFDTTTRMFGIRASPTKMSWFVMYRKAGRLRRHTFGTYPEMPLAKAREIALRTRCAVMEEENDPAAERKKDRNAATFKDLADEYMQRHAKERKKSWRSDQRRIDHEVLPKWGSRKLRDVGKRDILALVETVLDRGSPVSANRLFSLIRKMFGFAVERELLPFNPALALKRPAKERPRERCLSEDEIRQVWAASESERPDARALFRLRLLTAQRGGEISHMRWRDIQPDGTWVIPDEFVKNGKTHRVPLSSSALAILQELHAKRRSDSDWVFPSVRNHKVASPSFRRAARRIAVRTGIDFKGHDLRHTVATFMAAEKIPRIDIAKLLNHADGGMTALYDNHDYTLEKRVALETWARRLNSILKSEATSATVLPFSKAV